MKKTIISALVLMSGVLGFSGCVKNAEEIVNSEIKEYTLISHADAPNTRMNISGDKTTGFSTNWETGDKIGVYAIGEADHGLYTCNYSHTATVDQNGSAKFKGTIRSTGSNDFNLYAYYPYTAGSDHNDSDDQKGVNCKISSTQIMSGASFDKSCAYMVAKTGLTVNTASQDSSYEIGNWQFRHTVAFINLSTKAISAEGVSGDEIVSSVKFEAVGILENPTLAGDFQFNLEDGTMTFTKSESAVTVNVPANTKLSALSAWIVTNPFTMTADDELIITIDTDAHKIVKKVSIAKSFEAANVYTLNLAIDGKCEVAKIEKPKDAIYELVTDASTLAVGDQVIIVANDADYALGKQNYKSDGTPTNRIGVSITKNNNTIINPSSEVRILKLEDGSSSLSVKTFAFNIIGEGYLSATSSSSNYLATTLSKTFNGSWQIEIDNDNNASIVAQGNYTHNQLRYNPNPGENKQRLFACYNSSTSQYPVQIYRLQDDRTPLTKPTIGIEKNDTNKSIYVHWEAVENATSYVVSCTGQNGTAQSQTFNDGGEYTFENLEYGEYTVTVTASAEGYRPSSASETCEIINYQLPAPTNIKASGTTTEIKASWDKVVNASSYVYTLKKVEKNGAETPVEGKENVSYTPAAEDSTGDKVNLTITGSFSVDDQYVLYVKSVGEAPYISSTDETHSDVFTIPDPTAQPEKYNIAYTFNAKGIGSNYKVHTGVCENNGIKWTVTFGQITYIGTNSSNKSKCKLGETYAKVGLPMNYTSETTQVAAIISEGEMSNISKISVSGDTDKYNPTDISLVYSEDGETYTLVSTESYSKDNGNTWEFPSITSAYYAIVIHYSGNSYMRTNNLKVEYYTLK